MSCSDGYFDALGADWDRLQRDLFSDRVRERAFLAAQVRPDRIAADLGAGTGFITAGLLEQGLRVVAVDRSLRMLAALREKFPAATGLACSVGDAESVPIADASVDYCFANMCLHHVERPAVAIGEMARILKPQGVVVVTDLQSHAHDFLRTEHRDRWMGFEHEDVRGWFHRAGLDRVNVERIHEECCGTSRGGEAVAIGIFVAIGTRPARANPHRAARP